MPACFRHDLERSQAALRSRGFLAAIREAFPESIELFGCPPYMDKVGWDAILLTRKGILGMDAKIRFSDPRQWGRDDLAIELWSCLESHTPGYTSEITDYIVWYFVPTGRAVVVPYPQFKRRIEQNRDRLLKEKKLYLQETIDDYGNTYHSAHCYVPLSFFSDIALEVDPRANSRKAA